jgi:arsenate reductase
LLIDLGMNDTIKRGISEFNLISKERKIELEVLSKFISSRSGKANLIFICTHNSRRSHLSQIWAQIAANNYGFSNVFCYSGGTEATAFFPSGIEAIRSAGIEVLKLSEGKNPVYAVNYNEKSHPVICFSKKYSDSFNPQKDYAAIMNCDHADQNCPFIPNAGARIPIRYEDPKIADGTPQQLARYIERSQQICREMLYVFSVSTTEL